MADEKQDASTYLGAKAPPSEVDEVIAKLSVIVASHPPHVVLQAFAISLANLIGYSVATLASANKVCAVTACDMIGTIERNWTYLRTQRLISDQAELAATQGSFADKPVAGNA